MKWRKPSVKPYYILIPHLLNFLRRKQRHGLFRKALGDSSPLSFGLGVGVFGTSAKGVLEVHRCLVV